MKTIAVVISTRPDIIKSAMVIKEIEKRPNLKLKLIHTGQHYDKDMSEDFIKELGLPKYDLMVSGMKTHNEIYGNAMEGMQIGLCIQAMSSYLSSFPPDMLVVTGDTNSALAASIAASKLKIPIAHVEAGCRSFDKTQTEEINRICVDHIATYNFPATLNCWNNLRKEGITGLYPICGHPLVDLIHEMKTVPIKIKDFVYCTIHRRENIEDPKRLIDIIVGLHQLSDKIFIFFPVHPHTRKKLGAIQMDFKNILFDSPYPYYTSLSYIKQAKAVITDSGGVQMEAAIMGTPCFTIRDRTEWTETVECGGNSLIIPYDIANIFQSKSIGRKPKKCKDIFGEYWASKRIVDYLEQHI
jgi:UDP-GlcNAc3NAcA epimerase